MRVGAAVAFAAALVTHAAGAAENGKLTIPKVREGVKHRIDIDDIMALRQIDTISVSPDGRRFAILVRQADAATNDYRTAWFVGDNMAGGLTYAGNGGQVWLDVRRSIVSIGSRWSPDGRWIAYRLKRNGEVQVWRSNANGGLQEQLTHNVSDVQEFAWSDDGRRLYFSAGEPRAERRVREEEKRRQGYLYDQDFWGFAELVGSPTLHLEEAPAAHWVVDLVSGQERLASSEERAAFDSARARDDAGVETSDVLSPYQGVSPVSRADGALVWLKRLGAASRRLQIAISLPKETDPIVCGAEECSGLIRRVWWSKDGERVLFWRKEGVSESAHGFYTWSPAKGMVKKILSAADDELRDCTPVAADSLLCVRETPMLPPHLATIDFRARSLRVVADVNPEFRNIRLGQTERFEWDTPKLAWNEAGGALAGMYEKRAHGYIIYPPDFDPTKKYPVFIHPYASHAFNGDIIEHALHGYAANGFIVLSMTFPFLTLEAQEIHGASLAAKMYSAELDFPHLTMLMESTVRGLDAVASRQDAIDVRRVGIGGFSHGSFVPLYLLQHHDRIAAISVSSPYWNALMYYELTRSGRGIDPDAFGFVVKPEGQGHAFWSRIDIADHIEEIEAPILMQLADSETLHMLRLMRHLDDAGKPYEAFVFPDEGHVKWQPAHLESAMTRNLDWFRFWLQDYEDPISSKAEQYVRWSALRRLQCRNPRSLREYCEGAREPTTRSK